MHQVWEAAGHEVQADGPYERVPDQSQGMGTKSQKIPQSGKDFGQQCPAGGETEGPWVLSPPAVGKVQATQQKVDGPAPVPL